MKIGELKPFLDSSPKVIIFEGDEVFYKEKGIETIKKRYLEFDGLDFDIFEDAQDLNGLGMLLSNMPFMNKKRIVLVREFYPLEKEIEGTVFQDFLRAASSDSVLVVDNAKKGGVVFENAGVIDCSSGDTGLIRNYIVSAFKKSGLSISPELCGRLISFCGGSLVRVDGEIKKLASYCEGLGEVTLTEIDELVTKDTDFQVYELSNAVAAGNPDKAFAILDSLLKSNVKPQIIFISVYNCFRRMLHIRLSNKGSAYLAKELGIKEYAVKKSAESAARFTKKTLKNINDMLSETDRKLKKGLVTPETMLSDCTLKLFEYR